MDYFPLVLSLEVAMAATAISLVIALLSAQAASKAITSEIAVAAIATSRLSTSGK